MLEVANFKKLYGSHLVLDVPKLQIPKGIHWFKGSNGSGKTTFFKSLAGLLPFKGEVYLSELSLKKDAVAYRMLVNYSEAEPVYPEFLTALELIRFVAKAKKAPANQVEELVSMFDMESYMNSAVGTYSSGMLKKVSLVLGFLGNPRLIMLDEPLITIDAKAAEGVYRLIQEYRNRGVSFLLSSHQHFDFQELLIDSVYLVYDKKIIQEFDIEQQS